MGLRFSAAVFTGNLPTALVEVPFLRLPLALTWLRHPLAGYGTPG